MSLLARLAWGRCAGLVLETIRRPGEIAVVGAPRLARVLEQRGAAVVVAAEGEALPFEDATLAGVVAVTRAEPRPDWLRAVRRDGVLVLIAPESPTEMSRRALCAGLVDLRAARSGRLVVMSGRVWRPRSAPSS